MEQLSYAKQLLVQLNQQRSKGYLCDVIVVVQNALFRAHKNVLSASSSYFKSLLLHDNLLTLDTEMISPAVFKQVLDFIYMGSVTNPDHVTDQGVADLLTAASYLQVQHLTAYCHRRLRPSSSVRTPPTSSTDLLQQQQASNGHLSSLMPPYPFSNPRANHGHWWKTGTERRTTPHERHQRHHQGRDVSPKDEAVGSRWPSLRPSAVGDVTDAGSAEMMRDLGLDLTRKSPTEDLTTAERQQRAAARRRTRALGAPGGSEGWLQRGAPLLNGHYGRRSLEEEDRKARFHGGDDGTSPSQEEEERAGDLGPSREEEVSANHMEPRDGDIIGIQREGEGVAAACSYPQLPPGGDDEVDDEPAVGDNLYVCIPCGRGFSSSEQLNAHVDSHTAEELYMDVKVEEEEDVVTSRRPPCDFWRPHQAGGGNDPAAPDDDPGSGNAGVKDEEDEEENEEDDEAADPENHPEDASTTTKEELPEEAEEHSSHLHLPLHACSVCNQRYEDAASLRQHERSRHHWLAAGANATAAGAAARASFPCALCGKLFTQRGTMTRHMRSHLGLKPFACQECGMRFTRQYRLTEHARVHSGEKPYECRLCGGRFTQQRNLVSHLRMHTLSAS